MLTRRAFLASASAAALAPAPPGAALPAGLDPTPVLDPPPANPATAGRLWLNVDAPDDWSRDHLLLDEMRTARAWIAHTPTQWTGGDLSGLTASLGADGYPTRIPPNTHAGTMILTEQAREDAPLIGGRYRLEWRGRGTVTVGGGAGQTSGPNWREFDFTPTGTNHVNVRIVATDPAPNHVRGVRCFRLAHADLVAAGKVAHPAYVAAMGRPGVLRMMDLQRTNNSTQTTWETRATLTRYAADRGASVEEMVALCNEVGVSPWFCVPHRATDDHVERFAAYVRTNLDPRLTTHVEFSNEIWNWAFTQASWARDKAAARWGLPGDEDGRWMQFAGGRAAQVMDIWTRAFSGQTARLVRVAGVQTGWKGLQDHFLDAPLWVAEGNRKPADSFDAIAIAGYFDFPAAQMTNLVNRLASEPAPETVSWMAGVVSAEAERQVFRDWYPYWRGVAAARRKRLLMYEGGTHIVRNDPTADDDAVDAFLQRFNYGPEVAAVYRAGLAAWDAVGDGGFCQYKSVGRPGRWGSWGAKRHLTDSNPRWTALDAYNKGVTP